VQWTIYVVEIASLFPYKSGGSALTGVRLPTLFLDPFRRVSTSHCTGFAPKMASIRKQKSGAWRVQVRRKGRTVSETFVRYDDAKKWGIDAERQIDRGETPTLSKVGKLQTFGDLIDLHIDDMKDVGKAPAIRLRSKRPGLIPKWEVALAGQLTNS
jgi:hypothetical protein